MPLFLPEPYAPVFCHPLFRQSTQYLLFPGYMHNYTGYAHVLGCFRSDFFCNFRISNIHLTKWCPYWIYSFCYTWSAGTVLSQRFLLIRLVHGDFPISSIHFVAQKLLFLCRDLGFWFFHRPYSRYSSYHSESFAPYHLSIASLSKMLSYCLISVSCS